MTVSSERQLRRRVILVGIGGASCSGKTTAAKYLQQALPNSIIVHQDDFAPAVNMIPLHPTFKVQDWDSAPTAIDWPRFRSALKSVREDGEVAEGRRSHDRLDAQEFLPVEKGELERWFKRMEGVQQERREKGEELRWVLVDGFLMYWDKEVVEQLDVRLFLRVPRAELARRRLERDPYHTALQTDLAMDKLWRDPPGYFDDVAYPAYVAAHKHLFVAGDVEGDIEPQGNGKGVEGLIVCDASGDVCSMVEAVGPRLEEVARKDAAS